MIEPIEIKSKNATINETNKTGKKDVRRKKKES